MNDRVNIENIVRRFKAPTPVFWKKIRNKMILIGTVSGALLAAPIALPAIVVTLAGYGLAVGSVGAILAQATEEKTK